MTNLEVYQIFVDFFGEDYIDMQSNNIIIYFPKVRVTNEYDKYTDIYKLFVKIKLVDGKLFNGFELKRAEYTEEQFLSKYCHSHVPSIQNFQDCANWKSPCLGNGPIRSTIASLIIEGTKELWQLFCIELKKYVATESLQGGPYIRLETISSNNNIHKYATLRYNFTIYRAMPFQFDKFLDYIIKQRPFEFNYNGFYNIALAEKDLIIILSNLFIKWYNEGNFKIPISDLYTNNILKRYIIKDNNIYEKESDNIESLNPLKIITFKGKDIFLNVIKNKKPNKNLVSLLSPEIVSILVTSLINYINYGTTINKEQRFL